MAGLVSGRHGDRPEIGGTITELAARLDPARIAQIHRSSLVDLDPVAGNRHDKLSRRFVRARRRGEELPVSRAYVYLFKAM